MKPLPHIAFQGSADLSVVPNYARTSRNIDVKVYGRKSGHIEYHRAPNGITEKVYVDFSDDGRQTYSGSEKLVANPRGRSTYTANVRLTGPKSGIMDLKISFGPLGGKLPAEILFGQEQDGTAMTRGYVEYGGQRLNAERLRP